MRKPIAGEHCFGVMCKSCGCPILLDKSNHELTDDGKYKVTCSNLRCRHPVNEYDLKEVEHFQAP
jgi:hypothetical protein